MSRGFLITIIILIGIVLVFGYFGTEILGTQNPQQQPYILPK